MCIKVEITELSDILAALRGLSERMDKFIEIFGDVEAINEIEPAPSAPALTPSAPVQAAPVPAAAPVATAPPSPAPAPAPTVPTAAQTYTQDQLALAASGLIDAGRMTELQQLLASFHVQALTQLPKEHYGAFATKLRGMGAKI